MNESAPSSQLDRELRELRARAYGPHPDIQDDPEALARLAELEAARLDGHASAEGGRHESQESIQLTAETVVVGEEAPILGAVVAGDGPARRGSLWRRVTATQTGRVGLIAGLVVVAVGAWFAATWNAAPKPEATLQPTGVEADAFTLSAVSYAPLAEVDRSTLRGYERYRGLQPWVAENAQGSRCLLAIQGGTLHGVRCAPPEAELLIDIGAYPLDYTAEYMDGLADGTVIRFQLHGDTVDAYLFTPPGADNG